LRTAQERLLDYEVAELLAEAERYGDVRIVRKVFAHRQGDELKRLAQRLMESERTVALLGLAGDKAQLIFACSADLPYDMGALLQKACQIVGGRGGGQRHFAQGGGSDGRKVDQALEIARTDLMNA